MIRNVSLVNGQTDRLALPYKGRLATEMPLPLTKSKLGQYMYAVSVIHVTIQLEYF
jgi:hypothetical protein